MNLDQRSKFLKQQADQILEESKIVEILSRLGEVNFVGSYQLDLMYRPDIDIAVISELRVKEKVTEVVNKFIESGYFQTVGLADCFNFNRGPKKGFYIELVVPKSDQDWKFDIWYSTKEEDDSIEPTNVYNKLLDNKPEARAIILKLKDDLAEGVKYIEGVNGNRIYKCVLKYGIEDKNQLIKFIKENPDKF